MEARFAEIDTRFAQMDGRFRLLFWMQGIVIAATVIPALHALLTNA